MTTTLPPCRHRRIVHPLRAECHSQHLVHATAGMVYLETCLTCPFADRANPEANAGAARLEQESEAAEPIACPHRSEGPVRLQVADLCGLRGQEFPVYHCELHQTECTPRRICRKQTVRACTVCQFAGEDQPSTGES